ALLHAVGGPWRVSLAEAATGLRAVRLAGRFQRWGAWLFDVAHNPDGAAVLARAIRETEPPRPVTALLCVLGDKDWCGMLDALAPVVDHIVITDAPTAPVGRHWDAAAAAAHAAALGPRVTLQRDFDRALALAGTQPGTRLVTGSFHTVGDAMARLQAAPLAD
ncbi:MAG TPA: hypothetical protein VFY16_09975, partial [Gemmatimonadaceae bacterium]|nr:hypothetical protein [Gemmatimonadaceae bacterium]